MKKVLKTKILDIKFAIERLDVQCDEQQRSEISELLHQAMSTLDKAAERSAFIAERSSPTETAKTVHSRAAIKKSSKQPNKVAVQFKTKGSI
ncbi:MAG: hypothetical protein ACI808_003024 [Paraglaciecola sp.]|jgi:hypothetical protein